MEKKIAIMGLSSLSNYGEKFIIRCIQQTVHNSNLKSVIIDLEPKLDKISSIIYYSILMLAKIMPSKRIKYKLIFYSIKIRCYRAYKNELKNVQGIIIGAGSFKYGTQKLWGYYSVAVDIAKKYNIPIMFNAMNIQKYNEKDWRCQILKKCVNNSNVKIFTTRDGEYGVKRFNEYFNIDKKIRCDAVGDVALWIPNFYQIEKKSTNNVIGINLISGNIFRRYGGKITEKKLLEIYLNLLKLLDLNKQKWELYTNGLNGDYEFGKKLISRYGNKDVVIKVPTSDQELVNMISNYQKIVAARLHSGVCAYAIGKPFVGFVWDEKIDYFSKMAKIENLFIKEEDLTGELLFEKISSDNIKLTKEQVVIRELWKGKTKQSINDFLTNI